MLKESEKKERNSKEQINSNENEKSIKLNNKYDIFIEKYFKNKITTEENKEVIYKNKTTKIEKEKFKNKNAIENDSKFSEKIKKFELKSNNDCALKSQDMPHVKTNIFEKNSNNIKNNIQKKSGNSIENIKKEKNMLNNYNYNHNIKENSKKIKIKNNYYKNQIIRIINYFIIIILFSYVNTRFNLGKRKKYNTLNSYEITIKVKGTGEKRILSEDSNYYRYTCPSNVYIYLNNLLIESPNICSRYNVNEPNIEIKLVWNTEFIYSTRGMFYNCYDITEVDLARFDTSLVTDMSHMFENCSSLKFLNASNLNTANVRLFENMFYGCTSLISLNLESFTNPSATSLYQMFYGCTNLEYINIKNFLEKNNLNINNMFYNIPPNAIICLSSCPPPANLILNSMSTEEVTISWDGLEWNEFIIRYELYTPLNSENSNIINVVNKEHYTFTDLNPNQKYNIYIKTVCGTKSSYWLGPLYISFEYYNMYHRNTYYLYSLDTCSKIIYDSGGKNRNYENNAYLYLKVSPLSPSSGKISIKGKVNTEKNYDYLTITNGYGALLGTYSGFNDIPLFISTSFIIHFNSDSSNTYPGYELTIGCVMNSSQTIYNLIKDKSCYKISCDKNWKNIQSFSASCVKNCRLTSKKYYYRGNCVDNCPINTTNINFFCYSKYVIESCAKYTNESEYENSCTKCKSNYYSIYNDQRNKNNKFVACYKNNSLPNYYLDNNDLLFKPKACLQNGINENSNCLRCLPPFYKKYEDILKDLSFFECYEKLDGYYLYDDHDDQYFKKCYKSCDLCEKEGNITYHNCIKCNSEYPYELNISSYFNCYKKCEFDFFYKNKNFYCNPDIDCNNYLNEIELEDRQCIYDCNKFPNYQLEPPKSCYNIFPVNISITSEKEHYCEIKCLKGSLHEFVQNNKCAMNCALFQLDKNIYKIQKKEEKYQEDVIDHIKRKMITNINISELDEREEILIKGNDISLTITKGNKKLKSDTSSIDLGQCETRLKTEYHISQSEALYILKIDFEQEGYMIPKVQYEVYYPLHGDTKLHLLNLSICEDINMNIYIPVKLEGDLDLYVPNSDFYNDICTTFTTEKGTDLTISGRKNYYIENKMAICEEGCIFIDYNRTSGNVACSCKIKTDFVKFISKNNFNDKELYKSFTDFYNIFNIKILKCVYLIFTVKSFKQNYVNIIIIIIIVLYFLCLFFFTWKSYKNEIIFYIDIIAYLSLFPKKIIYILQKKGKKIDPHFLKLKDSTIFFKKNSIKKTENISNEIDKTKEISKSNSNNILSIKPPVYDVYLNLKKKLSNKKETSSLFQKNAELNYINKTKAKKTKSKKSRIEKIKEEENMSEKYKDKIDNYESFKKLNDNQIYQIYKKLYVRTDNELNDLSYEEALKYDRRTYLKFYFSLLQSNHLIFFSFSSKFDFNLRIIKMYLFFFDFTTFFFVNALFFTDETMGKINNDEGAFNFIYNLPQIIYSSIISAFINIIIKLLAITEESFINYRNIEKREEILKVGKKLKRNFEIKFIIFFIIDFIFLGCFWIYLSCFSAVYHNTQIHLIKDTLISYATSFLSPFIIYLLSGLFRIPSLKNKKRKFLFVISKILQLFL